MAIEILDDWNDSLACYGCCQMPSCPTPVVNCESATVGNCGHSLPSHPSNLAGDTCRRFKVRTSKRVVSRVLDSDPDHTGFELNTWTYIQTRTQNAGSNGNTCTDSVTGTGEGSGDVTQRQGNVASNNLNTFQTVYDVHATINPCVITGTYTTTRTYDDPPPDPEIIVTPSSERFSTYCFFIVSRVVQSSWVRTEDGAGVTYTKVTVNGDTTTTDTVTFSEEYDIQDNLDIAEYSGSTCNSELGCATARKLRFRFKIPSAHLGTYFKITYDIAEFPSDVGVDDFFVSENNVVEWAGPGNVADPNDPSWFTPWVTLGAPVNQGQRRVVNIRYSCYHGGIYGSRPQITGEGFTPPAP